MKDSLIKTKNKKYCYFCENYYTVNGGGYSQCYCKKYGSLDVDQQERHPDKTANFCDNYKESLEYISDKKELYEYLYNKEGNKYGK